MLKNLISNCLDILFPKSCFGCQKQGTHLCDDCKACLEISQYQYCLCQKPKPLLDEHFAFTYDTALACVGEETSSPLPRCASLCSACVAGKCRQCKAKKLDALYFALSYKKPFVKRLIQHFKYKPFIKELSQSLASLIIEHFYLLNNQPPFLAKNKFSSTHFILIPIPLDVKKLRWRGFNQAEEIAKELSKFLGIPIFSNCLIKIRETLPQIELNYEQRKENVKNAFSIKNSEIIKNKKILLIDDIYTTGSTMEQAAKVLKRAGAKEVIGIVVARG